jgi:hypothetical protein
MPTDLQSRSNSMKAMFVAALLAVLAVPVHAAGERSDHDDRWFITGMTWYEHPCGLRAFAKYGHIDTPEVRRAYEITKRDPTQCAKLFP